MGKIERSVVFKQALACGLALTMVAPAVPASVAFADQSSAAQSIAASAAATTNIVASGKCGENLTWRLDSAGTLDIAGSGSMDDYAKAGIPMGRPWEKYASDITRVKVEEGVTSIGGGAFADNFSALKSVDLPSTVTSIDDYAFANCSGIASVDIPSGVKDIGFNAFAGCSSMASINIPSGVESIDSDAFFGCQALNNVEIPSSVSSMGEYVFSDCSALKSVTIQPGLKELRMGVFSRCTSLESVKLPDTLDGIGILAFEDCSSLKDIQLPASVSGFGNGAFTGCSALRSVDIPAGVTYLAEDVFSYCSNLEIVSIPSTVVKMSDLAFYKCSSLSDAYYSGNVRQWANIDIDEAGNENLLNANVHCAGEPSDVSQVFSDASASIPHVRDIVWLADNGISTGYSNDDGTASFQGMTPVYRQDMAAFLRREAKLLGISDAATWTPSADDWNAFTDVNKDTPHAEDILWLHHAGIAQGYANGDGTYRFEGMTLIYRQDMAAFLHRLATLGDLGLEYDPNEDYDYGDGGSPFTETVYSDVNESTPHRDDIIWLTGNNISTGYDNGDGTYTYGGMTPTYRQDMAAFLHRFYGLKE